MKNVTMQVKNVHFFSMTDASQNMRMLTLRALLLSGRYKRASMRCR